MIPKTMKAVVLTEPTLAENVVLSDVSVPQVRPGWVLVKVKAFGLNHSEQILRLSEIQADYINRPIIPGIECVGEIVDPSDSHFQKGEKITALMAEWAEALTEAMQNMYCCQKVMYFPCKQIYRGRKWQPYRKLGLPLGALFLRA